MVPTSPTQRTTGAATMRDVPSAVSTATAASRCGNPSHTPPSKRRRVDNENAAAKSPIASPASTASHESSHRSTTSSTSMQSSDSERFSTSSDGLSSGSSGGKKRPRGDAAPRSTATHTAARHDPTNQRADASGYTHTQTRLAQDSVAIRGEAGMTAGNNTIGQADINTNDEDDAALTRARKQRSNLVRHYQATAIMNRHLLERDCAHLQRDALDFETRAGDLDEQLRQLWQDHDKYERKTRALKREFAAIDSVAAAAYEQRHTGVGGGDAAAPTAASQPPPSGDVTLDPLLPPTVAAREAVIHRLIQEEPANAQRRMEAIVAISTDKPSTGSINK